MYRSDVHEQSNEEQYNKPQRPSVPLCPYPSVIRIEASPLQVFEFGGGGLIVTYWTLKDGKRTPFRQEFKKVSR